MPRSIVFGNQSLLVCLDKNYNIRDIYFPHVGMENHLNGHECRIGIWVDNQFSWLENDEWNKQIYYSGDTLVGESIFENDKLSVKLIIKDCVYTKKNIFLREIQIENLDSKEREFRIFFSHDLYIYGVNIGITAYYDPDTRSVIHYLKDRWFLFNGYGDNDHIDGFATGKAHFGESIGTYKDAEDGVLSGNAIDQGTVDSTIQLNKIIKSQGMDKIFYWFTVGENYKKILDLNNFVLKNTVTKLINETAAFDHTWVNKSNLNFFDLSDKVVRLFKRSLLIVKSQMDANGAIIAANDSDVMQFNRDHYSYLWPRDGALVASSLTKAGYAFLSRKFYSLCGDLITRKGFLLHKYNPDGGVGSSWHPWYNDEEGMMLAIQEDETALVLYTLGEYYKIYKDLDLLNELYSKFIIPAADFMVEFRDDKGLPLPSYDLWEERRGIHTFTVASVIAGLKEASDFAILFGDVDKAEIYIRTADAMKAAMVKYLYDNDLKRFLRMINFDKDGNIIKDDNIDASLYAIFEFDIFPATDPLVETTMSAVKDKLWVKTEVGGVARYINDYYHQISNDIEKVPGNPWFICTLWLAEWYIKRAQQNPKYLTDLEKAKDLIEWVANRALSTNILAEQVNPYTNEPISVSPLTWSHATVVLTVLEYLESYSRVNSCPTCGRALSFKDVFKTKKEKHV